MYGATSHARYNVQCMELRDQAVRVELRIPASVVAKMARVGRETLTRYEIDPMAVHDEEKRARIASVYGELRELLSRFPLVDAAA